MIEWIDGVEAKAMATDNNHRDPERQGRDEDHEDRGGKGGSGGGLTGPPGLRVHVAKKFTHFLFVCQNNELSLSLCLMGARRPLHHCSDPPDGVGPSRRRSRKECAVVQVYRHAADVAVVFFVLRRRRRSKKKSVGSGVGVAQPLRRGRRVA